MPVAVLTKDRWYGAASTALRAASCWRLGLAITLAVTASLSGVSMADEAAVGPAQSQEAGVDKGAADAGSSATKFALAPGDRLSIIVFDQPDVSGNYLVEPDGAVTLPLLGAVEVAGLTTQTLQEELKSRFAAGYLQDPLISVRLTELRPVTVIGQVRAPGRYTFIDGMTVETLLALAGGAAALDAEEATYRADFLQADERLKALKINHLGQLARQARLQAQLDGKKMVLPDAQPEDSAVFKKLIGGEQRILDSEIDARERQAAVLEEQAKQIRADIATFEEQAGLEKEQGAFLQTQIADLRGLVTNGLTKKSTLLDMQREMNRSRANLAAILGGLTRAKSLLAETDLKLQDLETAYRSRIVAELQAGALQLAETESALPIAAESRQLKLDRLPAGATTTGTPSQMTIRRFVGGTFDAITANVQTEIWPGDLVQIGEGKAAVASTRSPGPALAEPGASLSAAQSAEQLSLR